MQIPALSEIVRILRVNPLWYLDKKIITFEKFLTISENERPEGWKEKKEKFINTLGELLENDEVQLGNEPEGFNDDDRIKIDTVVIHHTSTPPDTSISYLNALGLIRLYLPVFKTDTFKKNGKFQPISSGHFYKGKQTFVGYHYLVHENGTTEQILKDEYVGFHAGNYKTNCRSIGIAIVDNLSDKEPSKKALDAILALIEKYKPNVILGHGEVVKSDGEKVDTECPGKIFYTVDNWKNKLLRN